mgnify:CR=1 FL=1
MIGINKKLLYWLCPILVILMVLDYAITVHGLKIGYEEGHPIVRLIYENFGFIGLTITWGLTIVIAIWYTLRIVNKVEQSILSNRWYVFWVVMMCIGIIIRVFVVGQWLIAFAR